MRESLSRYAKISEKNACDGKTVSMVVLRGAECRQTQRGGMSRERVRSKNSERVKRKMRCAGKRSAEIQVVKERGSACERVQWSRVNQCRCEEVRSTGWQKECDSRGGAVSEKLARRLRRVSSKRAVRV